MNYPLHLAILVLLWGYIYTSWSIMGRLGLVSFGHGAFMGIGAYTVVMLWNYYGLSPWLGALAALASQRRLHGKRERGHSSRTRRDRAAVQQRR